MDRRLVHRPAAFTMAFRSEPDHIPPPGDGHAPPPTLLRALAEASTAPLLLVNRAGLITSANTAAERFFGSPSAALTGRPFSALFPEASRLLSPRTPDGVPVSTPVRPGTGECLKLDVRVFRGEFDGETQSACMIGTPAGRISPEQISSAFISLGQKLSEASSPREVAALVLETADNLFGWDCCFIDLVSDKDQQLHSILAMDEVNGRRKEMGAMYGAVVPGSNTQKTLDQGAHMILREQLPAAQPGNAVPFGNAARPSASLMFVPIRKENRNVGVLSIQSYRPRAYAPEDLDLLQAIADYSSGAFRRTVAEAKAAEAERAARESRERFQMVTRATNDAIYDWDVESGAIWWNDCMETLFGYRPDSVPLDINWWNEQIHPEDRDRIQSSLQHIMDSGGEFWSSEYRFRRPDGTYAYVFDRGSIVYRDGRAARMIGSMMDISARKRAEEELRHGAYHDLLTGLPNRAAFLEELERAVAHAHRRNDYLFAVFFLDLDRFKHVNDSLGHAAGDRLLVDVARRLQSCARPGDMVARLGGDEFIVLLDDLREERDATKVAEGILDCLSKPLEVAGRETFPSACGGIAFGNGSEKTAEELLRDADTAMYRAKALGRGRYHIFDAEMRERVVSVLQTETDLRHALDRGEFQLHYQPVIELETGSVCGFEALVRWNHPKRGLVPPGEFIPVAEDSGLVSPIGWWVLREACSTLARWQQSDPSLSHLTISVNLSARQIAEPDLVEQVAHALRETGLDPRCLKLEITETAIMGNAEAAAAVLSRLRDMEVQLYVDDFGTGHSSLSYLHRLPIHALKIDRSFVSGLGNNQESNAICSTIVALARNIGIGVIAEGLETAEQVEQLIQLGCRYGQGYYFSRPVDARAARFYISALDP